MFRESVLVNEAVIERISTTMVPVALDYQKVQNPRTRESRFMRPLMKQRNQEQGVWIFSPDGKALGGMVGFGDMVGKTRRVIDNALKAFGKVTPRKVTATDTHAFRGRGFMRDGDGVHDNRNRRSDPGIRKP